MTFPIILQLNKADFDDGFSPCVMFLNLDITIESCDIKLPRQRGLNSNLEISSCLRRCNILSDTSEFVTLAGSDQFPFGATVVQRFECQI